MSDGLTTVTSTSWFSRLFSSFFGVLIGFVVFLISFPVLFINEGRAVATMAAILSAKDHVVAAPAAPVDAKLEGKLVAMSAEAKTEETLKDTEFNVSGKVIALTRKVEMYQWDEETKSETRNKVGGGTETVKKTTYEKVWHDGVINSNNFKQSDGHKNPEQMPLQSAYYHAEKVDFGAFTLPTDLKNDLTQSSPLPLKAEEVTDAWKDKGKVSDGGFYIGADPASPQIGDVRVRFTAVQPAVVTVLAEQRGASFGPWKATEYRSWQRLFYGKLSNDEIIGALNSENDAWTWGLRGFGFVLMSAGLGMIFSPLAVLADVLPFLGTLVRMGVGMFTFAVAAFLSLMTIGVAWFFYRPMLALLIFGVGIAILALCIYFFSRRKAQPAPTFAG